MPRLARTLYSSVALLSLAAASSSCFAVTDLGRFDKADPTNFSDLRVRVRGLVSHVNERFEYRVVDGSNVIQSRGIIIPLGGPDATFHVHGAVPKQNGPFRLDFFADHDNSGDYDPRPDTQLDHSWRQALDATLLDERGTYNFVFDHNTSFTNLNTPAPPTQFGKEAAVRLIEMGPFLNRRVELRIAVASTKRVVALFRVPQLTTPEYLATVKGMTEPGELYTVEVYTDDGRSGGIRAFRLNTTGVEAGVVATFNGTTPAETAAVEVTDAEAPPLL